MTTFPVEIIHADTSNLNDAAALFDQYRQFYKQKSDIAAAKQFLAERFFANDSVLFLAYENGPVGFSHLYPTWSSVRMKRIWILNDLFVAADFRQRGIAKALLTHSQQWTKQSGAPMMSLQTAVDNVKAQRLYERLGWIKDLDFYSYVKTL